MEDKNFEDYFSSGDGRGRWENYDRDKFPIFNA